ncbi:MAG: Lrp/AsnC family transcriptional regulator [Candidatus Pacearchaeota archaeon]|jgi:DNA-binding Lrp family transcriptional regulator
MGYKLDLKDKKILFELDRNCRESYNSIARKVGLSKTAVVNRVSNMEKEGIIKGYSAVINYAKLGFYNFRIYINLQNTDLNKEKEIIGFLKEKEIVTWIALMEGFYNLSIRVFTKDILEINNLWEELMNKYINYFNDRLIVLNIKQTNFFRNYLIEVSKDLYEIISSKEKEIFELDNIESKIIEILSQDAKTPIIDIAKKVKSTPKTIISKIKKLEKEKIILYYRAILDSEKMNLMHFKLSLMTFNTTKNDLDELSFYIKKSPNIISREETLGGEDIELDLEVKDLLEFEKILNNIREKFGRIIQDYTIHHITKEYKNIFFNI